MRLVSEISGGRLSALFIALCAATLIGVATTSSAYAKHTPHAEFKNYQPSGAWYLEVDGEKEKYKRAKFFDLHKKVGRNMRLHSTLIVNHGLKAHIGKIAPDWRARLVDQIDRLAAMLEGMGI